MWRTDRHRHTDTQTQTHDHGIYRASIASRGKNGVISPFLTINNMFVYMHVTYFTSVLFVYCRYCVLSAASFVSRVAWRKRLIIVTVGLGWTGAELQSVEVNRAVLSTRRKTRRAWWDIYKFCYYPFRHFLVRQVTVPRLCLSDVSCCSFSAPPLIAHLGSEVVTINFSVRMQNWRRTRAFRTFRDSNVGVRILLWAEAAKWPFVCMRGKHGQNHAKHYNMVKISALLY